MYFLDEDRETEVQPPASEISSRQESASLGDTNASMFLSKLTTVQAGYDWSISRNEPLWQDKKVLFPHNVGSLGHAPRSMVGKVGVVPSEDSKGSKSHATQPIFEDVLFETAKLLRCLPVPRWVTL